ncbi:hypothetical protein L798_05432 [Zootermopsis nevadensis]|uniref:HMG box domain-containing protein n=1 Tax=Zootermopsis nevadensis TaxID=136037 RepID=A0A067QSB4_ZOONE|nr:hypothetical protein L798_05432 [Zootermopsis nevadensis]
MFVLQPACILTSFTFSICRLGCMWRTIQNKDKEGYFARARQADEEHRKKYPDYVYNPNVAREQKILRKKAQKKMLRHQSAKRRQSAKRSVSRAKTRRAREHQQAETTGGGRVTSSKVRSRHCTCLTSVAYTWKTNE